MAMKVIGGLALQKTLKAIPRELTDKTLQEAVFAGAVPIQDLMSALAPRGDPAEPNISNVVVNKVRKSPPGSAGVWIGPSQDAFYAYFVEFGTKHMKAQPFARPAFDREQSTTMVALADEVWDAILKAIR